MMGGGGACAALVLCLWYPLRRPGALHSNFSTDMQDLRNCLRCSATYHLTANLDP